MTVRAEIKNAIVSKIKEFDGTAPYNSNVYKNVEGKLRYWSDVKDYPFVCVTAGTETREYLPSDFIWGFIPIHIWVYVKTSNSEEALEAIFTDIENMVRGDQRIEYATGKFTEDIQILSISSDEGLLEPLRIGEILLQVRYEVSG